jgi:hypothetical protein
MGKSFRDNDWSDRDAQLTPDFFSEAEPVYLPEITTSEIRETEETLDEETQKVTVYREVPICEANEVFVRREPAIEFDHDFGSYGQDSPKWLKAFYDCVVLARGMRRTEVSRIALLRYERRGSAGIMLSSLPTNLEASIDVELCAKRALSDLPAHHALFVACYLDGTLAEDSIPLEHRTMIVGRVGKKLIERGIYPLSRYFNQRVSVYTIQQEFSEMNKEEDLNLLNAQEELTRELRNKRRRAKRADRKARRAAEKLAVAA